MEKGDEGPAKRIGVVFWERDDGLALGHIKRIRAMGHEACPLPWNASLPGDLDMILVYGPIKSMVPLVSQIHAIPPNKRPALAFLMTEQLPNPSLPEWFRAGLGYLKSRLDRLSFLSDGNHEWVVRAGMQDIVRRGRRYCYYGDLYWMRDTGVLNTLGLWSNWTADFLRRRGFDPMVLSQGWNPDWGDDLHLERDIPVLWLGKPGSRRRRRILAAVRAQLAERGIPMLVIDGVEHPYVFDDERTVLLNRSKIVLNILREKWDDNTLRFGLAAQNKALIISEPMLPHSAYKPGIHYVEAPVDYLAETITYYLDDEASRTHITDQAYDFMRSKTEGAGITAFIERALRNSQRRA